jgi:Trk K+ transport system NAD-binding subunit
VDLEDHVVVCEYTPHGESLVEELEVRDVEYVIVKSDVEEAADLMERGYTVMHGDPELADTLERANVTEARAVVADASDERNASIVLTVHEVTDDTPVVTLVEEPRNREYHRLAGAMDVISPEQVLGESLVGKVTTRVKSQLGNSVEIGTDFELAELSVQFGSPLCDLPLAESGIRERTGANVIGVWDRGEFVSPPPPDLVIDERTVLLVVGTDYQLNALKDLTRSRSRRHSRDRVVVAGHGEVGKTISESLASADVPTVVVDKVDDPRVDVVGDATDEWTLSEADIETAGTLIVALGDDTEAVFATLVAREMNPEMEIIARANDLESVGKMYRAGADYVLALSTVSGRMLASTILEEDVVSLNTKVEIVRTPAPELVGYTLAEADVRARTGCTIIAIERDGALLTDIGPDSRIEDGDELVAAGPDADVNDLQAMVAPSGDDD